MKKSEQPIDLDEWDFGFTAVHESDLESVQSASSLQKKVDLLYAAMGPLLKNLKQNPEKDYIFWPDRLKKVAEFEEKLKKIYEN
jgi:hypothetical protein